MFSVSRQINYSQFVNFILVLSQCSGLWVNVALRHVAARQCYTMNSLLPVVNVDIG